MDSDILIIGGVALLYFLLRPQSAYPQTYPYPSTGTAPRTTPPGSSGGGSIGGGSIGGGGSGGGGVSSGGGGIPGQIPAPSSGPVQGPFLQPGGTISPVDSMDPCDINSSAYDPTTCANQYGSAVPVDSGDPCYINSVAYDPNICASQYGSSGVGPTDMGYVDPFVDQIV